MTFFTFFTIDTAELWTNIGRPLLRLVTALCIGLLAASLVEALRWTRPLARLSAPLVRLAHLREAAGASFSLAFFSPPAANALLSESHANGETSLRELMLANIFNSLPSYMVHLPSMLLMLWPVLGTPALTYTGLTLAAATARTLLTVFLGRLLLPLPAEPLCLQCRLPESPARLSSMLEKAWIRFKRRVPKLIMFTVPVYILMYALQQGGAFRAAEGWLAAHVPWLSFLKPEALGIVMLSLAAEIGASLSAAGSALDLGALSPQEIVLALLIGNILSTPMRAIRHQFPSYAGYYRPVLALKLLFANQSLRAISMIAVAWLYWYLALA